MPNYVVFEEDMTMSRKEEKMNNRCPICGGRMRLVNVTWINTFQTPEAAQYDLSVSRRKALRKKVAPVSSQEMMCSSCCRRSPIADEKGKPTKAAKKVKKEIKKDKNIKKKKKKNVGRIIRWIFFLAVVAVIAYFAYKYSDVIGEYANKAVELFNTVKDFITKFTQK